MKQSKSGSKGELAGVRKLVGPALVLIAMIICGGLSFHDLTKESFWIDEKASINFARMNFFDIIKGPDLAHPPGYHLILHYWLGLAGDTEFSARALAAIFAILSVGVIFLLGRELFSDLVGIIASYLMAFSSFFIYYAQEARTYTLLAFLTIISTILLIRILKKGELGWEAPTYVAVALGSLYIHYFFMFAFALQASVLLLYLFVGQNKELKEKILTSLKLLAPIALIFGFWIFYKIIPAYLRGGAKYIAGWIVKPNFASIVDLLNEYSGFYVGATMTIFLFAVFLLLFLAPIAVEFTRKSNKKIYWKEAYVLAAFFVPTAIVFILSQKSPIWVPRYLIIVFPFFILIIAKALSNLRYKAFIFIGVAFFAYTNLHLIDQMYQEQTKEDWRSAIAFVASDHQQGDLTIRYSLPDYLLDYYAPSGVKFENGYLNPIVPGKENESLKTLKWLTDGRAKVRVVYTYYNDSEDLNKIAVADPLLRSLDKNFNRTSRMTFTHILIDTYVRPLVIGNITISSERSYSIPVYDFTGKVGPTFEGKLPFYGKGDVARYSLKVPDGDYILAFEMTGTSPAPIVLHYTINGKQEDAIVTTANEWKLFTVPVHVDTGTFSLVYEFKNDTYIVKNGKVIADNAAFVRNIYLIQTNGLVS